MFSSIYMLEYRSKLVILFFIHVELKWREKIDLQPGRYTNYFFRKKIQITSFKFRLKLENSTPLITIDYVIVM